MRKDAIRDHVCGWPSCLQLAARKSVYCSRACRMKAQRANQTPERRREIGQAANRALQERHWFERLVARVMVFADTERDRILLAYRYGLKARNTRAHRQRKQSARECV